MAYDELEQRQQYIRDIVDIVEDKIDILADYKVDSKLLSVFVDTILDSTRLYNGYGDNQELRIDDDTAILKLISSLYYEQYCSRVEYLKEKQKEQRARDRDIEEG